MNRSDTTHSSADGARYVTLTIEKLVNGGAGFSKHDGRPCFIEGVLPGETVRARITDNRTQYVRAQLCEIVEPSPSRVEPACPVAGLCGGCQWQHLAYSLQLSCKAAIVAECLQRIGGLRGLAIQHTVASPLQTRYRSRASFKISTGPDTRIGFYQNKTHRIVDFDDCLLLEPPLVTALQVCRDLLRAGPRFAGYTDLHLLSVEDDRPVVLCLWHDRHRRRTRTCAVRTDTGLIETRHKPVQETVSGVRFIRDTGNFYQVNRLQNQALIKRVVACFSPADDCAILDMYCGCGNFSLFLARQGARVTGIDGNPAAVDEARHNARINGLPHTRFITGDSAGPDGATIDAAFDGVLLNPPRSGCGELVIAQIVAKAPSRIVYVSCSPATLSRDVHKLCAAGYGVDMVQPFDMFPQTFHVETVVALSRLQKEGP